MSVLEIVMPRICRVPADPSIDWSIGDHAVQWCRDHNLGLDPEQEFMLRSMLGLDLDGRWVTFEWALSAPRQNGKGEVLLARELYGLFVLGEMLLVHSAHEFKTSARHFERLVAAIRVNEDLLALIERSQIGSMRQVGFRYTHGDESITLQSGARIEFRTRTKSGLKGVDDVALLVLDESQILSEWAHGTMVPTLRASRAERGPQLVYAGNAPDKEKDDHAIVWTRLRERALDDDAEDDSLVYHEYSLDYETPEDVPEDVISDHAEWAKVNWAMAHGRVTVKHMEKEFRTFRGGRQFVTELLNVGDYPDTDLLGNSEISLERWAEAEDEKSELQDPVCISYDVSPGRRTTISAAGLNGQRKKHVEVITSQAGTAWLPARLAEICERHEVVEIATDGFGPGKSIAPKVEEATGMKVRLLKTDEYVDACAQFATAVDEDELVHIGQDELSTSVRGARTRPLVDRWAWSRSKSKTDPGPVISCSVALFSAVDRDVGNQDEWGIL